MNTIIIAIAAVIIGIPAAIWVILQIRDASHGLDLRSELADVTQSYNRVVKQANDDREQCARDITEVHRDMDTVKGELKAYRREYASSIAKEVAQESAAELLKALAESGWIKPEVQK